MKSELPYTTHGIFDVFFAVEDMVRCPGNCAGCILTKDERTGKAPAPELPWNDLALFCKAAIAKAEGVRGQKADRFGVTFGQGDHLLLFDDDLRQRVKWSAETFGGRAEVFLTVAGIGKHEIIERKAKVLASAAKEFGQLIGLDLVFDPTLVSHKKFRETYAQNIATLFEMFDVDLTVNVAHDTVQAVSPEDFFKLVMSNGFRATTINYVPTRHTAPLQQHYREDVFGWLTKLYSIWNSSGRPFSLAYGVEVERLFVDSKDFDTHRQIMVQRIANHLRERYYIGHDGNIFFQQASVGDFPLSDRTGWGSLGHVSAIHMERLPSVSMRVASDVVDNASETCRTCEFFVQCARGAQLAIARLFTANDGECPTAVKLLMQEVASKPLTAGQLHSVPSKSDEDVKRVPSPVVWDGLNG